ncbi:transposase family protein [Chloroflexi bacterium CFX3]|nr:transposase family protein [Chloroflexi bacterium CFX3]
MSQKQKRPVLSKARELGVQPEQMVLELVRAHGLSGAAKFLNVNENTVRQWLGKAGYAYQREKRGQLKKLPTKKLHS